MDGTLLQQKGDWFQVRVIRAEGLRSADFSGGIQMKINAWFVFRNLLILEKYLREISQRSLSEKSLREISHHICKSQARAIHSQLWSWAINGWGYFFTFIVSPDFLPYDFLDFFALNVKWLHLFKKCLYRTPTERKTLDPNWSCCFSLWVKLKCSQN